MRHFLVFFISLFLYFFISPLFLHSYAQYFFPKGNFGSASCTNLIGWTCDQDNYNQSLTVNIYRDGPQGSGGVFVGTTVASLFNANSGAFCGGNSNHGFTFTIPDSLKTGTPHSLYVYTHDYPAGTLYGPINGSPKTITCSLSIQGSFFSDTNLNGSWDSGESFVAGGQVTTSPTSSISYPTVASYQASNLAAGAYNVSLTTVPSGYVAYYPNNGTPPFYTVAVGNSCSTDTAHGSTCNSSGNIASLRFALRQVYTINGNVFIDSNRNGVKDGGETNYSGATINLGGTATSQTTSGGSGNYTFTGLYPGNYTVTVTLPNGYYHTTSYTSPVTLGPNGTVNFGMSNTLPPQCNSSYNYNGLTQPAVWRPASGTWYIYGVSTTQYGEVPSDIPTPADYDGDGITDFAFFKTQPTQWYTWLIRPSGGNPSQILVGFGGPGDIPVPGDYNGDSISDIAVWRPSNGYWYIRQSSDGVNRSEQYGESVTDFPVPGDYDGDGKADLALFKGAGPSGYNWLIRPSSGASQILASYGGAGDTAAPGDYNGDGVTDIAVWRYSTGSWYIRGINDGGIGWGQAGDIPIQCVSPTNAFYISGNVFIDHNGNGTQDGGENGYSGSQLTLTGGGLNRIITTDSSGNFVANNIRPKGLTNYTMTLTVPSGFVASTTNPLTVQLGPNKNVTFGIQPQYQISGVVFNDQSKDGIKNGSEPNMSSNYTIQVVGPSGNPTTQNFTATNGVYTTGRTLSEGTYTVSYTSAIPDGYRMTNPPPAISPPSFSVTIGTSCDASAALGASCISAGFPFTASDVQNLNFGMTNYIPWFQCIGNSCRIDGTIDNDGSTQTGFSDPIPDTALLACGGANASIPGSNSPQPGIIFSGGTAYFGQGQASDPQNWVVNDSTYSPALIRTSYGYMITTLRQSGITPIDLASVCTLSNCTLPADLTNGVYLANGDVTLNAYTFPAGKSYVILINGDLTIVGEIHIPVGSAATFSVAGDIIIDSSIGVGIGNFCSQDANVEGFFSTDGSFIIGGIGDGTTDGNTDCNLYSNPLQRDQRFNLAGAIVVNAAQSGGSLQNQRDLCQDDRFAPVFSIIARPDFLLSVAEFVKYRSDVWKEVAP